MTRYGTNRDRPSHQGLVKEVARAFVASSLLPYEVGNEFNRNQRVKSPEELERELDGLPMYKTPIQDERPDDMADDEVKRVEHRRVDLVDEKTNGHPDALDVASYGVQGSMAATAGFGGDALPLAGSAAAAIALSRGIYGAKQRYQSIQKMGDVVERYNQVNDAVRKSDRQEYNVVDTGFSGDEFYRDQLR